ncbi:MAG: hypothetical protein QOI66_4599 [Myxococcales bacterium]|jgi:hypothetical protein|nr:hypothetical protein [Myxococcales bacterium]
MQNGEALNLGEIVAASCDLGSVVAADRAKALDLAASHLGRVLARSRNARLVRALAEMARELTPADSHGTSGRRTVARQKMDRGERAPLRSSMKRAA